MATKMRGVTCIERNGTHYYYARVGGQRVYCGKGEKGLKLAEAARAKEIAKRYENREMIAGLKVKKVDLKTVKDLANWYMTHCPQYKSKGATAARFVLSRTFSLILAQSQFMQPKQTSRSVTGNCAGTKGQPMQPLMLKFPC
jgi:hypothetical protein